MLTRPFTRLVVAFGHRYVTQRRIVEEVVLGFLLVFPFGIWMGLLVIRVCAKGNVIPILHRYIRSDVWTTIVVFLVGDMLMEFLLPSLQCLPLDGVGAGVGVAGVGVAGVGAGVGAGADSEQMMQMHDSINPINSNNSYNLQWLSQTYGLNCPYELNTPQSHHLLLTPDATALLFTLRLLFLCAGVYLGESFFPIALTGGIACGKSTVATLLVDYNNNTNSNNTNSNNTNNNSNSKQGSGNNTGNTSHNNNNNHNSNKGRRKFLKSNAKDNHNHNHHHHNTTTTTTPSHAQSQPQQEEKEGTVHLIDADAIAHEILLPPSVLATTNSRGSSSSKYTVHPQDSVYPKIVQAFGHLDIFQQQQQQQQQDDNNNDNDNDDASASSTTTTTRLIDRRKLGALIFQDPQKRRLLNSITHPQILYILVKRLVKGIFTSQKDLIIADIPLLFESGKLKWLFGLTVCVVVSDPAVQLQRLQLRHDHNDNGNGNNNDNDNGDDASLLPPLSRAECQARIQSQLPMDVKRNMADLVIENDGSLLDLSDQVEDVRRELMARIYGIGMSLLQMLLLIGGSTSIAVSSKFYTKWGD
jgi:dephospho-CoA kinase